MLRKVCILVADGDPTERRRLTTALRQQRARVLPAATGAQALEKARELQPDVVLLDTRLPGLDGFAVCRELRLSSDVPVLLLTARRAEADRIRGLDLGADDYILKPCGMQELVARIRAVLRRAGPVERRPARPRVMDLPDLLVNTVTGEVNCRGHSLHLTAREFDLLVCLARHSGQALSREQLFSQVWGSGAGGGLRSVDVYVKKLRRKLGQPLQEHIRTIRGYGYRFEAP